MSLWAHLDLRYEWFRWNWIVSIKRNVNHKFNPEIFGNCCNRQQWFCQWWNKWKLTLVSSRRSFSRAFHPLEHWSSGPLAKIPGSPLQYELTCFVGIFPEGERKRSILTSMHILSLFEIIKPSECWLLCSSPRCRDPPCLLEQTSASAFGSDKTCFGLILLIACMFDNLHDQRDTDCHNDNQVIKLIR